MLEQISEPSQYGDLELLSLPRGCAHISRHLAPILVAPLDDSAASYQVDSKAKGWRSNLDRDGVMIVGTKCQVRRSATSSTLKESTLIFHDEVFEICSRQFKIPLRDLKSAFSEPRRLKRSQWMSELIQRLNFERFVCHKPDSLASQFVPVELLKEIFFCTGGFNQRVIAPKMIESGDAVIAAVTTYIARNLEGEMSLAVLAKVAKCSVATLVRRFKKEMKQSPRAFVRGQRLDRARQLLKSRKYSVSEVASQVGYEDLSAFSKAFKQRFRMLPSVLVGQRNG